MLISHRLIAIAALGLSLWAPACMAQATRTWVSGVGDDANPCSRTAPCKTFAGAISKTAIGGQIDALDPAGFGTVTITKPITIDGGPNAGGILASGTIGISVNVNAATPGAVVLRNLKINGAGTTLGTNGINILAGDQVRIQNVDIERFSTNCIKVASTRPVVVSVLDATLQSCGNGLNVDSAGGAATATLERSNVLFNTTGVLANGADSTVRLSNSSILDNTLGLSATGGAGITSFNNNRLKGNTTDGAPTLTQYER